MHIMVIAFEAAARAGEDIDIRAVLKNNKIYVGLRSLEIKHL